MQELNTPVDERSVDESIQILRRPLGWLDHVAEWEYSEPDRLKAVRAMDKCGAILRRLACKYVDGEE